MVSITKSPQPKAIKSESDLRSKEIVDKLSEDCRYKCYICEKKPTSPNVEHIVPCRKNEALQLDWDNLLIACARCNNIKGTKYHPIINPTKCDPEDFLSLSLCTGELIEKVVITQLVKDQATCQTAELLHLIYNGNGTALGRVGAANLLNEMSKDIRSFYQYIKNYETEPGYADIIRDEISRASTFSAFKRKIVRDNPTLSQVFVKELA